MEWDLLDGYMREVIIKVLFVVTPRNPQGSRAAYERFLTELEYLLGDLCSPRTKPRYMESGTCPTYRKT